MTIEQTIEIPENHRVFVNIPPQIPAGKARIAINILEYTGEADIEEQSPRITPPRVYPRRGAMRSRSADARQIYGDKRLFGKHEALSNCGV
jgi:hypothetical protein